jgi:hypothetical protein
MLKMWEILAYIFSVLGMFFTVLEIVTTVIKGTSLLAELIRFIRRYVLRRNKYYRNFKGLRIEYWLDHPKIVADEQRAKFNVQIENVSESHFSEVLFFFKLPKYMEMTAPKNIIKENLRNGQTTKYLDKIGELSRKSAIRRQYELSYEGKDLFVQMEITPYIVATKEINEKRESIGPQQLKELSLEVKRKR